MIVGALRAGSTNRLLAAEAVAAFGPAEVAWGDLRLPLFDEDVETAEGIPAAVHRLAAQVAQADAVLIAVPEYNKALPGVLKNALDWISRVEGAPFRDRPVAIMSAADGRAGGERAQFSLRLALNAFRPRLLTGPEVMVPHCRQAFDGAGRLTDDRTRKQVAALMAALRAEAAR